MTIKLKLILCKKYIKTFATIDYGQRLMNTITRTKVPNTFENEVIYQLFKGYWKTN